MSGQPSVHLVERADDLPADEWATLVARSSVYCTQPWLRHREQVLPSGGTAGYFLGSTDGTLVAGATAYAFDRAPHHLYDLGYLTSGLVSDEDAERLHTGPHVIGAGWAEFKGDLPLAVDDVADADAVTRSLLEGVLEWARARGAALVPLTFLGLADAMRVKRVFGERATVVFSECEAVLPTRWADIEEYLAFLPKRRRHRVRRELRDIEQAGRVIDYAQLDEVLDVVVPLNENLMRKYGHAVESMDLAGLYRSQSEQLSDQSRVLLLNDTGSDKVIGFSLNYRHGRGMYGRVVGFDYTADSHANYFNLVVYEPIRQARRAGYDFRHMGVGSLPAKLNRGAAANPVYHVFLDAAEKFPALPDLPARVNADRISAFRAEYGAQLMHPVDFETWVPDAWPLGG